MRALNTPLLACLVLVACPSDPAETGTETEGTGSTGTTTSGPSSMDTTMTETQGTSSGSSSTAVVDSSSTGPGCTPGDEDCVCDDRGMCADGLECIDDMCVATLCGNGALDDDEECDDGNGTNSDGCDNDCTVSAGAAEIVAGDEHVCALFHSGDIKCWGNFNSGRLGYLKQAEDVGDDETPADMDFVDVGAPVQQLALGSDFTCALLVTEEVICWGSGQNGRLGQGSQGDLGSQEVPADIPPIDLGGTPIQIAAGAEHACAVLQGGDVRCWGRNNEGQLGLPGVNMVGDDELPGEMPVVDVGSNVQAIAAGTDHTCALLGSGGVLCWGIDDEGQLGTPEDTSNIGDDEPPSASTEVLLNGQGVLIAGRYDHTCVAYVGGDLQCWGGGGAGRLGYGDTEDVGDNEDVSLVTPLTIPGGEPSHIGTGAAHTCVHMTGTPVYCWGEGNNGRLGYGNTDDLFEPAGMQVPINLPVGPRSVTTGMAFTCGTSEGSEVKCWGANNRGQLGYGAAWDTDLGDNEPIEAIGAVMLE